MIFLFNHNRDGDSMSVIVTPTSDFDTRMSVMVPFSSTSFKSASNIIQNLIPNKHQG